MPRFHASLFCCYLWIPCRTCHKELGTVSRPLPVFPLEPPFFLALSLKGTGNEWFDWLIIPLPLTIPFTLFSLDRRRRKRDRKKKKLFRSFWLRFRRASDSASDSSFWFTLDRNAPCASDSDSASDSVVSVNQPLTEWSSILFISRGTGMFSTPSRALIKVDLVNLYIHFILLYTFYIIIYIYYIHFI